jgi:CheY-like chemotaxis protein
VRRPDGQPVKILVADDQPQVLDFASRVLDDAGHQVLTAIDGGEALRRIHESHPDLVLLDIRMPGKDGTSVVHELRGDPATRDIPVVFLTGLIRRAEAQQRGSRHLFLAKPFDAGELLRIVTVATRPEPDARPA